MEQHLIKQLKFLKIYAGVLTVACIVSFFLIFKQLNAKPYFKEINVEKINVVEKGGKIKMVISNQERQHPGIVDGKEISQRDRPAGIIFFNEDGDECGGLVFDGNKNAASMAYSVDQYKNDQIMQLQYSEIAGKDEKPIRSYGLKLWDRSDDFTLGQLINADDSLKKLNNQKAYDAEIERLKTKGYLGMERLFLGKTRENEVGLFIRDDKGRPRIKVYIDQNNQAVMEALDDMGNVLSRR